MKLQETLRKSGILLLSFVLLGSMTLGACAAGSEVNIVLSDTAVTVDGATASEDVGAAVYLSHDIIYYEDRDAYDSGNPYGEGTASERHSAEEAATHTVVNITKPGTYRLTGKMSQGQIFVDLGEDAKTDPKAVVTLILDNVDLTCTVAPAIFFYRVYECDKAWVAYDEGEADDYVASATQDTAQAGANVVLADGSVNRVTGSHVARIYKDNGNQKKLHKYDAAFYSRMSMNVDGQAAGTGVLNITADNEGLDSELHLTINGGKINIQSQDDGINTNEDNVSVTTINGGAVHIVAGLGSEGDGIDSNGYLVINGGVVIAIAKPQSDSGLDSDCGSYVNGGYVIATGSTMDWAESDSEQVTMNLQFASSQNADDAIIVTDLEGKVIFAYDPDKDETTGSYNRGYQGAVVSCPQFQVGETYYVYIGGDVQGTETDGLYDASTVTGFTGAVRQQYTGTDVGMFRPGGMPPNGAMPPDGGMPPDGQFPGANGDRPEFPGFNDGRFPDGFDPGPGGMDRPGGRPDGMEGGSEFGGPNGGQNNWMDFPGGGNTDANAPASVLFYMTDKVNAFSGVSDETASPSVPTTPSTPSAPTAPVPESVVLSPQKLTVDGKNTDCEKYNIDGSNYFKLRDLAQLLNGTGSQFGVGYDEATSTVSITTGVAYASTGTELAVGVDNSSTAQPSSQTISINGEKHDELTVYNIGGSNFFQLRQLGTILGFEVDYDESSNTAIVRNA